MKDAEQYEREKDGEKISEKLNLPPFVETNITVVIDVHVVKELG